MRAHTYLAIAGSTTTTERQYWGHGSSRRNPGLISERQYYKKYNVIRRATFDPTPSSHRHPFTEQDIATFAKELQEANPGEEMKILSLLPSSSTANPEVSEGCTSTSNTDVEEPQVTSRENPEVIEDCTSTPNTGVEEPEVTFVEPTAEEIIVLSKDLLAEMQSQYPPPGPHEVEGTEDQYLSPTWHYERGLRAPAASSQRIHGLSSARSTMNGKKNFLRAHVWNIQEKKGGRMEQALEYGRINESKARQSYAAFMANLYPDLVVLLAKMTLDGIHPQLSRSPDALLKFGFILLKLIEFKCPITMQNFDPNEFDSHLTAAQLKNTFLQRNNDNSISLKKSSPYYSQVQQSMYILKVQECDFVVWSPKGMLVLEVTFDPTWWEPRINVILRNHRALILPERFSKRAFRNMDPLILNY